MTNEKKTKVVNKVIQEILKSRDIKKSYIPPQLGRIAYDVYQINETLKLKCGYAIHIEHNGKELLVLNSDRIDRSDGELQDKIYQAISASNEMNKSLDVEIFLSE